MHTSSSAIGPDGPVSILVIDLAEPNGDDRAHTHFLSQMHPYRGARGVKKDKESLLLVSRAAMRLPEVLVTRWRANDDPAGALPEAGAQDERCTRHLLTAQCSNNDQLRDTVMVMLNAINSKSIESMEA
jgi:hypothetical protein